MTRRRVGSVRPPPYAELSPHSSLLESAVGACGNGDAAFYLQKARMSFIKARASKPVRQADMRGFVEMGRGHSRVVLQLAIGECSITRGSGLDVWLCE